jgi:hypothetical protein
MLDIESLRNEAFQHLHQLPNFCADVILLIEELETAREEVSIKNVMLEDDARIIHGLVDHYRKLESVAVVAKRYVEGMITKDEFDTVWDKFEESLFVRP